MSVRHAIVTERPDQGELDFDPFEPSPRIQRIRQALAEAGYSICLERPRLLRAFERSRVGKAARAEHPYLRRARALGHVLSQRRPRIYADELIVGNMTSKRVAANFYPEGASLNILEDIPKLDRKAVPLQLDAGEKRELFGLCLWSLRRSIATRTLLRPGRLSYLLRLFNPQRYIVTEEAGISHQVPDYRLVVHEGLRAVDARAQACLDSGRLEDGSPAGADELAFFESVRIVIAGIRAMADNLASECERLAESTPEPRRAELLRAAAACRRVPYEPARSLQEGLQAIWLVHVALNLEDYEQGISFGRLDQILDPLYRADLDAGALDRRSATELIASFELKAAETMPLYSERVDLGFSGNTVGQAITVGGVDADGDDVSNELSGLFLDAFAQIRTREPNLQVRVHAGTPDWLLDKAVRLIQLGCGSPALFGDAAIIAALQRVGVSEADARDYALIGCVEVASQGRTYNSSDAALFNLPLCLELALNQGRSFAGERIGAATPAPAELGHFDDVVAAFQTQVEHAVDELARIIGWMEACYREHRPTPINSLLTAGCLASGKDVTWGGAVYDLTSIQAVGLADAGDSLLALRRLVFEERAMSLAELVELLREDFAGQEPLRVRLRQRFGHYGNGDAEADAMTARAADVFVDAISRHRNSRGGRWIAGFYTMTCGTSFGKVTGALPNGRRAGARLSNGFSPIDGCDREGPTALLRSAASLPVTRWANGGALNLKFDARTVGGEVGRRALASLFRTYLVDHRGLEVQVNVLDADMLRAAKADPTAYPNLLVRVSGYCAYFNDLQPEVQDELIERTSHAIG